MGNIMGDEYGIGEYEQGRGIYLLYYPASAEGLEDTIEFYRPDAVAVELDERRYLALRRQRPSAHGRGEILPPGTLMVRAIESAERRGLRVAFIDRDSRITASRLWNTLTLREKLPMLLPMGLASLGFAPKETAIDHMIRKSEVSGIVEDLRTYAPSQAVVILDERDAYMARNLLELSRTMRVLGIVGAGHRAGIHEYLENPDTIPPAVELCDEPKKRS